MSTASPVGFRSGGVMNATNVRFDGTGSVGGQVTADGQLMIGSTAFPNIRVNTLTAGPGISIANGAGSITISNTGVTSTWTDEAAPFAAVASNGYFVTAAVTATLPAGAAQGDTIQIVDEFGGGVVVQANAAQQIRIGSVISAVAGSATTTARGDSITLVFRASNNTWIAVPGVEGNWTVV